MPTFRINPNPFFENFQRKLNELEKPSKKEQNGIILPSLYDLKEAYTKLNTHNVEIEPKLKEKVVQLCDGIEKAFYDNEILFPYHDVLYTTEDELQLIESSRKISKEFISVLIVKKINQNVEKKKVQNKRIASFLTYLFVGQMAIMHENKIKIEQWKKEVLDTTQKNIGLTISNSKKDDTELGHTLETLKDTYKKFTTHSVIMSPQLEGRVTQLCAEVEQSFYDNEILSRNHNILYTTEDELELIELSRDISKKFIPGLIIGKIKQRQQKKRVESEKSIGILKKIFSLLSKINKVEKEHIDDIKQRINSATVQLSNVQTLQTQRFFI